MKISQRQGIEEFERPAEISVAFTREADDDVASQRRVRKHFPGRSDDLPIVSRVVVAPHPLEDPVLSRLRAHVKMGTERVRPGHQPKEPLRQLARVQRAQTHPRNEPALNDSFQQRGQVYFRPEILAVASQMNASQHYLHKAPLGQRADLRQHLFRRDAAARSPRGRDDAVGAGIITPLLNLDKGARMIRELARAQHWNAPLFFDINDGYLHAVRPVLVRFANETHQIIQPVKPYDVIHAGHPGDLPGVDLRITARKQHSRLGAQPLGAPHQLARLPVGAVRYRTAVDDIEVGLFIEGNKEVPVLKARPNDRGVILVDLAAERGYGDLHATPSAKAKVESQK